MHWYELAFLGVVLTVVVLVTFLPRNEARQQQILATASRAAGLALDPGIEQTVLRRSRRSHRYSLIGGAIVWLVATLILDGTRFDINGLWLLMGTVVFGGAFGNALAAFVDAHSARLPDLPRFARSTAVTVADYVPRWQRDSGWIATAVMIAGSVWCALVGVHDPLVLVGLPLAVCLSAFAAKVLSAMIVARPQHAASAVDLAWDDALRVENLKAMYAAAPILGVCGLMGMTSPIWLEWNQIALYLLVIPVLIVVAIRLKRATDGAGRYYLRRLWPETAAQLAVNELAIE